ncbi:Arv1-domain-containing protein [Rickenella mellea]|uniref:Protein ARV n=1 Tax=Rickenella mellea TaxID=50990 RepID=A0A4Y7QEE0_9AGAM|nr:Arv1-domain-containing protein [Rickenella mellea]
MPICTSCTYPSQYLYTVYQSAFNLRLEQCVRCKNFVDPYVEHDDLTLLLDLILLKRGVYRHLLFNRGRGARKVNESVGSSQPGSSEATPLDEALIDDGIEKARWMTILKLGLGLIFMDSFIRWSHLHPSNGYAEWWTNSGQSFLRIFAGCLIETAAFHAGITVACAITIRCLIFVRFLYPPKAAISLSGIHNEFRLSHVPLTLLYSSLTKLFLLFMLSVWKPSISTVSSKWDNSTINGGILDHYAVSTALEMFDDDKLDREWVVRNVLGGMAAGFGLRVVLDIHPFFTTIIVLSGWVVKTIVASFVQPWVAESESTGEVFLQYSIP